MFLCHFPSSYPDWPLASTLPSGARTFLPCRCRSDHPAYLSTIPKSITSHRPGQKIQITMWLAHNNTRTQPPSTTNLLLLLSKHKQLMRVSCISSNRLFPSKPNYFRLKFISAELSVTITLDIRTISMLLKKSLSKESHLSSM